VSSRSRKKKRSIIPIILVGLLVTVVVTALSVTAALVTIWFTTHTEDLMPPEGVPTPLDGSGRATVSPDVVQTGQHVKGYTVSYTTGQYGLMEGAFIHLFYPSQIIVHGDKARVYVPYLAWKAIREFMDISISAHAEGKARLKVVRPSLTRRLRLIFGYYRSERKHGRPAYTVRDLARELVRRTIKVTKGDIAPGEEITIHIGKSKGMSAPDYAGWVNISMKIDGDGDGIATPVHGSPRVVVIGAKATRFRVVAGSVANVWEKVRIIVEPVDDDGQIDPNYTGIVYLDAPEVALPGQTTFELSDFGRKVFFVRTSKEGIFFVTARDDHGRRGKSNPIIVRESGPHLYWGDLHIHTVLGMGDNPPESILRVARDELGLDFAAVCMIDNDVPLSSHDGIEPSDETNFGWSHLQKIAHLFDKADKFAVFPAFDWASNRFGHRLVIYSPGELQTELFNHADTRFNTVEKLFGALAGRKALVMPIWSAWRGGEFMGKRYDWGPVSDRHQRLVEVYSSDGAVEFYRNPYPMHGSREVPRLFSPSDQASRTSGAFVRDALAQGARLGLIAGGSRRFSHERAPFYSGGLTAVWGQRLTSFEIWHGLYTRRTYGTTGARIYIEFKVGEVGPGLEISAARSVPIEVFIVGTAPIENAQIVRFGSKYEVTRSLSSKTEVLRTKWMEVNPPRGGFYFLRVKQKDGHMAWAGPVWVSR